MNKFILIILIVAMSLSSCFQLFDDPSTTLDKALSNYDRTKMAVVLFDEGNTTVDFSLQVAILKYGYHLTGKELGNTFTVDRNHGATVLNQNSINLSWISNDTLQIDYDKKLRTFIQKSNLDSVTIIYKPR